jgi:hypothetical protein
MMLKQNNTKWYLIGATAGLLAGALLYFVQPVKWKGQALIRIGQFSQSQGPNGSIEPIGTLLDRLKTRSFAQAVAVRTKRSEFAALLSFDEGAGMSAKPTRNSDSLEVVVIGGSVELAQVAIDGVVEEIIAKHDELLTNYLADSKKELVLLNSEIDVLAKQISNANVRLTRENGSVAALLIIATQPALEFKRNKASSLREAMSSTNIRRTMLVEIPSISERRILASLWRAGLLGALLGLLLTAVWIRWNNRMI